LSQQQLAQHMQVATQDTQPNVTRVTPLTTVTTTLLAIAALQRTNRRFHTRMTLAGLAKLHRRFLVLLTTAPLPFLGDTRMRHDASEFLLIVRRMKGPIERGTLNLATHPLLQLGHHRHYHILIQDSLAHHLVVADKASGILNHQHLVTELDGVRLLAPLDQLRVRLKDAEQLFLVDYRFTQQDTPPSRATHFLRQLQVMQQLLLASTYPVTQLLA